YRHHDYNIAVMESFSGKKYASYFLHGEHLIVDGRPMSKSLGNILYPDDLVDKGYEHKHLRFFLIYTYYRKKLNFTDKSFAKASDILDRFRERLNNLLNGAAAGIKKNPATDLLIEKLPAVFEKHMDNDLHLGEAFEAVYEHLGQIQDSIAGSALQKSQAKALRNEILKVDTVLGVIFAD
ncbi:MAG: class I tRNA ligase family protein, partial [Spirochaetales bacterium]|nr:class I tRNA ligase family protein [Spirochaetales bacterium]